MVYFPLSIIFDNNALTSYFFRHRNGNIPENLFEFRFIDLWWRYRLIVNIECHSVSFVATSAFNKMEFLTFERNKFIYSRIQCFFFRPNDEIESIESFTSQISFNQQKHLFKPHESLPSLCEIVCTERKKKNKIETFLLQTIANTFEIFFFFVKFLNAEPIAAEMKKSPVDK